MIARVVALSSLVLLGACANGRPAAIAYDADTCTRCHMQISDRRFSAVLVTRHGRSLKFDSIDCLRAYYARPNAAGDVASVWVADFAHPGRMLPADRAKYFDAGASHSPMGKTHGWAAVAGADDAAAIAGVDSTRLRAWTELP
jgi:nitrous oxide reductase accessory protein NosL